MTAAIPPHEVASELDAAVISVEGGDSAASFALNAVSIGSKSPEPATMIGFGNVLQACCAPARAVTKNGPAAATMTTHERAALVNMRARDLWAHSTACASLTSDARSLVTQLLSNRPAAGCDALVTSTRLPPFYKAAPAHGAGRGCATSMLHRDCQLRSRPSNRVTPFARGACGLLLAAVACGPS